MTTPAGTTPAGWYDDPAGTQRKRWWDGTLWTEHYSEPYAATAAVLTAPAGTKVYNLWIWLVVFLPYLSLPLLFTIDIPGMFAGLDYSDPSSSTRVQLDLMTSPAFILVSLAGWLLGAATVMFAWLDWRWLTRAGVPKPFHWAFAFFGIAGYPVYAIGRAVVTRRRTGAGMGVLWAVIGMFVLGFIIAIVWAATIVAAMVSTIPFS